MSHTPQSHFITKRDLPIVEDPEPYSVHPIPKESQVVLAQILNYMETKVKLPTVYSVSMAGGHHAKRTGARSQKQARQALFGFARRKAVVPTPSEEKCDGKRPREETTRPLTKYAALHPELMDLFRSFIESLGKGYIFEQVYVNYKVRCKPHLDSNNVGTSLLVGLGDYSGGESHLFTHGSENPPVTIDIKSNYCMFDGSKLLHSSGDFEGDRYSLVFFNSAKSETKTKTKAKAEKRQKQLVSADAWQ